MKLYSISKKILFALLVAGTVTACSNSVSDDHDDHSEPEGFRLKMNGQTIVEQLPEGQVTGEIEIAPGEETDLISIVFIAHDGDEFTPEEDEYSLGFEFETDGIAEFEQHDEDGKWSFHIHGESEGVTDLRLMLMHNSHSDFSTQDIHVHVE
jgi:hypothetical protein